MLDEELAALGLDALKDLERGLLSNLIQRAKGGDLGAVRLLADHLSVAKAKAREIGQRNTGRRTTFTPELAGAFVDAARNGASNKIACDLLGMAPATFYKWQQRADAQRELLRAEAVSQGKEPEEYQTVEGSLVEFFDNIARARAELHQELLGDVRRQSRDGNVKASTWLMEHKFPQEYRESIRRLELTGAGGGPLQVRHDLLDMTPEQLAALAAEEEEEEGSE